MSCHVRIAATLQAASEFSAGLDNRLAFMSQETRTAVVLAVQELCVNIVKHAYAGTPGTIDVELELNSDQLALTFYDQADQHYTPPDEITAPDPLDLPASGLGIPILHQVFDRVEYEPLDDGNRWTLSKWLGD